MPRTPRTHATYYSTQYLPVMDKRLPLLPPPEYESLDPRPHKLPLPWATYNVHISSKAIRNFPNLGKMIVQSHLALEPTTKLHAVKVITNYMHPSYGDWPYVGGMDNEESYRYMRIIIDIPAGRRTAAERKTLMEAAMICCLQYTGKHAIESEIEIRVNQVSDEDIMRMTPLRGNSDYA